MVWLLYYVTDGSASYWPFNWHKKGWWRRAPEKSLKNWVFPDAIINPQHWVTKKLRPNAPNMYQFFYKYVLLGSSDDPTILRVSWWPNKLYSSLWLCSFWYSPRACKATFDIFYQKISKIRCQKFFRFLEHYVKMKIIIKKLKLMILEIWNNYGLKISPMKLE